MALVGYWKCNESPTDQVTSVADSSGHANNHDFTSVGYYTPYGRTVGQFMNNYRYSAATGDRHISVNNNADFLITGDMTIAAWVRMHNPLPDTYRFFIGCGAGGVSEVQADNIQWSLIASPSGQFGMLWENGAGVDVLAYSPVSQLDQYSEDFQHIAVIRSTNLGLLDVKFVLNGVDLGADITGLALPDGGANAVCEMLRMPGADARTPYCNIANVRVYDTAETVGAMASVYASEGPEMLRLSNLFVPPEELIGNEPDTDVSIDPVFGALGTTVARTAIHTGTRLDQVERPNSGWARVGP